MSSTLASGACPYHGDRDDRKSATLAAARVHPPAGTQIVDSFGLGRDILRSPAMKQAGLGADQLVIDDPDHAPVFFLDGEPHRRKRAAIARFFTPKAISGRHSAVMARATDALLADLQRTGRGQLDRMSWKLAVEVAGTVIGLTESDWDGLAKRIEAMMDQTNAHLWGPVKRLYMPLVMRLRALNFLIRDVRPAAKARRAAPQEDVITHLVQEGYSEPALLIECMTYASAGMVTTREFITMVAWHLFERDDLRQRYLAGSEEDQLALLEEILRIEPVAALLYRKADADLPPALRGVIAPGETYAVDMRSANVDEAATGPCPFAIDPDRAAQRKTVGSFLSFGDGNHRCPGSQIALHETRIFIDRLFRVPGIRLEAAPKMTWNDALMSYELREAIIGCDRS